jgi:hypothetical protein
VKAFVILLLIPQSFDWLAAFHLKSLQAILFIAIKLSAPLFLATFVIKMQKYGVGWASVVAMFPVSASYAVRHFTNFVELIRNSQPFFRNSGCHKYWLQYFTNGFAGLS